MSAVVHCGLLAVLQTRVGCGRVDQAMEYSPGREQSGDYKEDWGWKKDKLPRLQHLPPLPHPAFSTSEVLEYISSLILRVENVTVECSTW